MKTIVITPEAQAKGEIETCNLLLQSNIERLHVRKPFASAESLKDYVEQLDSRYYSKISLHSHHELVDEMELGGKHFKSNQEVNAKSLASKSFHSFDEIENESTPLSYGFLSPIFESISKVCYAGEFDQMELKKWLRRFNRFPVYALGGMTADKTHVVRDMGFEGMALLGDLWSDSIVSKRIEKVASVLNA
ncbi:thiamine-phosphate pyrophosphorylase [Reichenbachiella faecimaris]|uniref:Thiamine-phosphate pyrophosphorylase n=1 Tax=Reichenbachiella faecimaris TaxID=692418 RepID=A0A1W2G4T2_REIFA|nr:thiamine phosphate synthase [Reichenbachiella faecimaris]SMD31699.1 thiamine-phosphate pyrophosphorylase [Reichenbachiella faecimaris]